VQDNADRPDAGRLMYPIEQDSRRSEALATVRGPPFGGWRDRPGLLTVSKRPKGKRSVALT
jgi:hypothetical protein